MARAIIGVIVGYAIWTCIWLGGNAVLLPDAAKVVGEGQFYGDAGPLAIALVLSVVCSLAAGIVTTSIARPMHRMRCGIVLSIALLLTGIDLDLDGFPLGIRQSKPIQLLIQQQNKSLYRTSNHRAICPQMHQHPRMLTTQHNRNQHNLRRR